jgi:hypothetical protein
VAASPDMMPPLSLLAKHGMADYSARAIEFDKPVGSRGIQADLTPTLWKVTITSLSASRPMIVAVRKDLVEAETDARTRFLAIFRDKKDMAHISVPEASMRHGDPPRNSPEGNDKNRAAVAALKKAKERPRPEPVEDEDDGNDLI